MMNIKHNGTIEFMTDKIKSLKGKSKLNFHQKLSDYYAQRKFMEQSKTFQFEKDSFAKNAEYVAVIIHEASLIVIFLQTKPQMEKQKLVYNHL